MGAREVLRDLTGAGFSVEVAGDRLLVGPASKLTDDLRAAVRAAKPDLLALLNRPHKLTLADPGLTIDRCHRAVCNTGCSIFGALGVEGRSRSAALASGTRCDDRRPLARDAAPPSRRADARTAVATEAWPAVPTARRD